CAREFDDGYQEASYYYAMDYW
nr:immunoglobulin heavy chain junction region [Mus musculus]